MLFFWGGGRKMSKSYNDEKRVCENLFQIQKKEISNTFPYSSTPPLGKDMTQGQFLSGVK